jgi:signal transduction histidine kinase
MSRSLHAPRLRPERLIAAGRVGLAVSSLFAVWLDPNEPAQFVQAAYGLLAGYVAYAAVVAVLVWRAGAMSPLWPVAMHATDLVFFSLFIFFTDGPASPFNVYFVFALICATLRWQARGTVWTAVVILAAFIGFGVHFGAVLQDPEFDLRAFIIRGVYMVVLAVLLAYVGAQDQRTLHELWRLASWPQVMRRDVDALARDLLGYAGPLLEAPRVVLVWAEADAPARIAEWNRGAWTHERLPAGAGTVHPEIGRRAFICTGAPARRALVQEAHALQLGVWQGDPLDPALSDRLRPGAVLSVSLPGESFDGRLFFLDKRDTTLDDLLLAEIVAGVVAARLDAFYLTEQLRQGAATEERIRLARDLHDGVLQSFTGVALRLAAIRRRMAAEPEAAAAALEDVQRVLASEQRDIRFFIQELKPAAYPAEEAALAVRLTELARRMEREWDLRVELHVEDVDARIPMALCRDLYHLVREALVNAARHGGASLARVRVEAADSGAIAALVADNGRGFAFSGSYSAEQLAALDLGPRSVRERVLAMHGTLTLQSGPDGAALHFLLPAAPRAAANV